MRTYCIAQGTLLSALLLLLLLSRFSRVQLCATPWMAAHQVPPSLGFSSKNTVTPTLLLLQQLLSRLGVSGSVPVLGVPCKWGHTGRNFCDWLPLLSRICLELHGRGVSPLSLLSGLPLCGLKQSCPFL